MYLGVNMAHYAFLDEKNLVTEVIVGKEEGEEGIDWEQHYGAFRGQVCKRTSYNTHGGQHPQGKPLRKNFAGIGYFYDEQRDAFIEAKPFPSWVLNEFSCMYNPPIKYPDKTNIPDFYKRYNNYKWDEDIVDWKLIKPFESWVLTANNYYISPIPYPNDGLKYIWDENLTNWILLTNNG